MQSAHEVERKTAEKATSEQKVSKKSVTMSLISSTVDSVSKKVRRCKLIFHMVYSYFMAPGKKLLFGSKEHFNH